MKHTYINLLVNQHLMLKMLSKKEVLVGSESDVLQEFVYKAENENLLGVQYNGRVSSGYDPWNTRKTLEGMKTCDWKYFFSSIEKNLKITNCWVVRYDEGGIHRFHKDKSWTGTHRWIISLGCMGKEFWMRCSDGEVQHKLRHGSVVIMDSKASGYKSDMEHSGKGNAGRSWAVIIETNEN